MELTTFVWEEPNIVINGTQLSIAQAMTVRVAIETFAITVSNPDLGPIGPAYLDRIEEIRKVMYRKEKKCE